MFKFILYFPIAVIIPWILLAIIMAPIQWLFAFNYTFIMYLMMIVMPVLSYLFLKFSSRKLKFISQKKSVFALCFLSITFPLYMLVLSTAFDFRRIEFDMRDLKNMMFTDNFYELAFPLQYGKKYDELIRLCEEKIEKQPLHMHAYFFKGQALQGLGRYKEAIEHFQFAMILKPDKQEVSRLEENIITCQKMLLKKI